MSSRWLINLRGYPAFLGYHATRLLTHPGDVLFKLVKYWKLNGVRATFLRIYELFNTFAIYDRWCRQYDMLMLNKLEKLAVRAESLHYKPKISVLMPVWNTPEKFLRRAIESIRAQIYPNWELCLSDDASTNPNIRRILEEYRSYDDRIKIMFRVINGHISEASNSALELCTGEYTALLDHDDELPPDALFWVTMALNENPNLELIYTDEDKIDANGRHFGHYFKPDWNPELLLGQNMISHLGVYRTTTMRRVGGFRKGYEGCQDWDLALRFIDAIDSNHIYHIPRVLYHWRALAGSTAIEPEQKSYVIDAAKHTVKEHLTRKGIDAHVEIAFSSFLRVRYPITEPAPRVSVILFGCESLPEPGFWDALRNGTAYSNVQWIVTTPAHNNSAHANALERADFFIVSAAIGTSCSEVLNTAAMVADGEILCFIDFRMQPLDAFWLEELVSQALQPKVGVVGGMIYASRTTIRSAGIVLGLGPSRIAGNSYAGSWRGTLGYCGRAALAQCVSALSRACFAIRKSIFNALGGFDTVVFPNALADVDLCLRISGTGLRNIWTPYTKVIVPGASVDIDTVSAAFDGTTAASRLRKRWGRLLDNDPYFNPNLSLDEPWPTPAFPPRVGIAGCEASSSENA